jgi:hypothetical protein
LIQKDYDKLKFEYDKNKLMEDMNYEEESKRVQELRKAAVEVDRSYLINKHVMNLKMKLVYGDEKD